MIWPGPSSGLPLSCSPAAVAALFTCCSPGCLTSVLVVAFPGGAGTASLVREARRMASRSPVPTAVVEISPAAGL